MEQFKECPKCHRYKWGSCKCKMFELHYDGGTFEQYGHDAEDAVELFAKNWFYQDPIDPHRFEMKVSCGLNNFVVTAEADVNFYTREIESGPEPVEKEQK